MTEQTPSIGDINRARDMLRQIERRAELAAMLVGQREDQLADAQTALTRAQERLHSATVAETTARAELVGMLRAAGCVQTADGILPAAVAERQHAHRHAGVSVERVSNPARLLDEPGDNPQFHDHGPGAYCGPDCAAAAALERQQVMRVHGLGSDA
jgi:hypothetical protein